MSTRDTRPGADATGELYGGPDDDWTPEQRESYLREDNDRALVFWWYASTCRHLGIGGTHEVPLVAANSVGKANVIDRLRNGVVGLVR